MWQSSAAGMLDSSELKTFKGLHFFDVDPSYRCDARIMWYPQTAFFDMPHTDGFFRPYMKVGEVHLKVKDKAITLYAYQTEKMRLARKKANEIDSTRAMAQAYCDQVKPYLESIRDHADRLEILIDNELWPLPKYRELLFLK